MLAVWGGTTYQILMPDWLNGAVKTPIVTAVRSNGSAVFLIYPFYRLVVLAVAVAIGIGALADAQQDARRHDDPRRRRRPGDAVGDGRQRASRSSPPSSRSARGLPGLPGVVGGSALSIAPGEDVRYLLASLVVVIVGGMGSITGAAIGALLIGLAEQIGLVYFPTYGVVLTFVIMVVVLAVRPQGMMGRAP